MQLKPPEKRVNESKALKGEKTQKRAPHTRFSLQLLKLMDMGSGCELGVNVDVASERARLASEARELLRLLLQWG